MLKYIFIILFLGSSCETGIQTVEVISFRWVDGIVARFGITEKKDPVLRKYPVIKIVTCQTRLSYDFGSAGNALAIEQREGEIWLWVPSGAKQINISDKRTRLSYSYPFGNELQNEETYELIIKTDHGRNRVNNQPETKWVTIDNIPKGANLFIDDYAAGQLLYYGSLTLGSHKFRLEYHGEKKEETITISKETGSDFMMGLIKEEVIPDDEVPQIPEFPGGYEQFLKYCHDNVRYPLSDSAKGIQGTVYVQFFVNKTGKLSSVHVVRKLSSDCDKEAVRVVKMMPNWIPGRKYGVVSTMLYWIPVKFRPSAGQ